MSDYTDGIEEILGIGWGYMPGVQPVPSSPTVKPPSDKTLDPYADTSPKVVITEKTPPAPAYSPFVVTPATSPTPPVYSSPFTPASTHQPLDPYASEPLKVVITDKPSAPSPVYSPFVVKPVTPPAPDPYAKFLPPDVYRDLHVPANVKLPPEHARSTGEPLSTSSLVLFGLVGAVALGGVGAIAFASQRALGFLLGATVGAVGGLALSSFGERKLA